MSYITGASRPYADEIREKCVVCGDGVWIRRKQFMVMRMSSEPGHILCFRCLIPGEEKES